MGSRSIPGERQKLGEYILQSGEQGKTGTGNKKGEYSGNSRIFGKTGNFPPIQGNPVPREYATKTPGMYAFDQ